jgi:hypothetical protein
MTKLGVTIGVAEQRYAADAPASGYPGEALPVTSGLTLWVDNAYDQDGQQYPERSDNAITWQLGSSSDADTNDPTFAAGPPGYLDFSTDDFIRSASAGDYYHNEGIGTPAVFDSTQGRHTIFFIADPNDATKVDNYLFGANPPNYIAILHGYVADKWEYFIGGSQHVGDDPRTNTAIDADAGAWQTIAYAVGSSGAGKQKGYKNGVEQFSNTKTYTVNNWTSVRPLAIATSNPLAPGNYFEGKVGQFLMYNRQLSESEIEQLHNHFASYYGLSEV